MPLTNQLCIPHLIIPWLITGTDPVLIVCGSQIAFPRGTKNTDHLQAY